MMGKWLETSSLKCTLEKCEGNVSLSNNCDKKCSDMTVSGKCESQMSEPYEPSMHVLKVAKKKKRVQK
jgi:hypothetical protein